MWVEHLCGHQVNVIGQYTPFIRRTLCQECRKLAVKLRKEQQRMFEEVQRS